MKQEGILNQEELKKLENCYKERYENNDAKQAVEAYEYCEPHKQKEEINQLLQSIPLINLQSVYKLIIENNFNQVFLNDFHEYKMLSKKEKENFPSIVLNEIIDTKKLYLSGCLNFQDREQLKNKENQLFSLISNEQILLKEKYAHQRYFILNGVYRSNLDKSYKDYCNLLMSLFYNATTKEVIINPLDMVSLSKQLHQVIEEKREKEDNSVYGKKIKEQHDILNKYFGYMLKPVLFEKMECVNNSCKADGSIPNDNLCNLYFVEKKKQFYLAYKVKQMHINQEEAFNVFDNKSLGNVENLNIYPEDMVKLWLMKSNSIKDSYTVEEVKKLLDNFNNFVNQIQTMTNGEKVIDYKDTDSEFYDFIKNHGCMDTDDAIKGLVIYILKNQDQLYCLEQNNKMTKK